MTFSGHDDSTINIVLGLLLLLLLLLFQLVNNIRARRGNACVRICTPLQAFIHKTDTNSELQRYTAELQDRAPLQAHSAIHIQFYWIASPATRYCLSWHWILWRLLPLKPMLNDYSRCVVI